MEQSIQGLAQDVAQALRKKFRTDDIDEQIQQVQSWYLNIGMPLTAEEAGEIVDEILSQGKTDLMDDIERAIEKERIRLKERRRLKQVYGL